MLFKSLSVLLVLHYGCTDQDQISWANLHHILTGASPGVLLSFWINKHDSTPSFYHLCGRGNNRNKMGLGGGKTSHSTSSPKNAFSGILPGLFLKWRAHTPLPQHHLPVKLLPYPTPARHRLMS